MSLYRKVGGGMFLAYSMMQIADLSEEAYRRCLEGMPPSRRAQVERLHFPDDRRRTVAGECLARRMIARYCGLPPAEILFARTDKNKPFAVGLPVHFSVSHSGAWALCALSNRPVGADIEKIRPVRPALIRRVCTPDELAFVHDAADSGEAERRFFRVWTGKEAFFKREGTGITSLQSISVLDETVRRNLIFFCAGDYAVSLLYTSD